MKVSGDVWRRLYNDEGALWLHLAILGKFRLEEPLLLPPGIPRRFDGDRVIGFVLRVFEGFDDYN